MTGRSSDPGARSAPALTKSRYLSARQCEKRAWLQARARELAAPASPAQRFVMEAGVEVGRRAHELFPGGVLVDEPPWAHAAAVARTRELLANPSTPTIFEAAFEHAGVRVRVDVLERLPGAAFGLREVKSAASVKPDHLEDLAVQIHTVEGSGLPVASAELVHVRRDYVRPRGPIDWAGFFARAERLAEARALLPGVAARARELVALLAHPHAPAIEAGIQCVKPHDCEFLGHCAAGKPPDWIVRLPHLRRDRYQALRALGVDRIAAIPDAFELNPLQRRVRDAVRSGAPFVSGGLARALEPLGPPTFYLDFETLSSPFPPLAGMRPFEALPFQWSLHRVERDRTLRHFEFLADAVGDPRRGFAERLLDVLLHPEHRSAPILVYSPFESQLMGQLAERFDDLAPALRRARARLVDLLSLVRHHVYHPRFAGSFSIKSVAPGLVAGFGYGDLDEVADGGGAQAAFARLGEAGLEPAEAARLRRALLAYCRRDTLALVEVHRVLRRLAAEAA